MSKARAEPIVALILAGGRSIRMGGGDKALLALAGVPMLQRVIDGLRPQVDGIMLNANGDAGRFASFGLPVIPDMSPDLAGPLAGLLTGLSWVRANRPDVRVMATVASDTPFFPSDLVERLLSKMPDLRPAIAGSAGRRHPAFGLWPIAIIGELEAALADGERKMLRWVDQQQAVTVEFAPVRIGSAEVDPFFNVNTPEDLAIAEAILGACGLQSG